MHDIGVPKGGSQHKWCLVLFVERDAILFVAERNEDFRDLHEANGTGEVEGGVRDASGADVGVFEEVRMGLQDASGEERVVGVNGTPEAEGGVDPGRVSWDCTLVLSWCLLFLHRISMASTLKAFSLANKPQNGHCVVEGLIVLMG